MGGARAGSHTRGTAGATWQATVNGASANVPSLASVRATSATVVGLCAVSTAKRNGGRYRSDGRPTEAVSALVGANRWNDETGTPRLLPGGTAGQAERETAARRLVKSCDRPDPVYGANDAILAEGIRRRGCRRRRSGGRGDDRRPEDEGKSNARPASRRVGRTHCRSPGSPIPNALPEYRKAARGSKRFRARKSRRTVNSAHRDGASPRAGSSREGPG